MNRRGIAGVAACGLALAGCVSAEKKPPPQTPDNVKPGNKMYYGTGGMAGYMKLEEKDGKKTDKWVPNITVNDSEARALVAYLRSLK